MTSQTPVTDHSSPLRPRKRLTVTVPHSTLEALVERSSLEGRSLSNLAAYLIESALEEIGRL